MKDKKKIGLILMYLSFGIVMAGLGANDALRGVFSPIFKDHFTLSSVQISMIIVMSYAGNLIFLWAGTRLADRFEKKKVMMGILLICTKSVLATNYLKDKGIQNVTTIGVGLDLDNLVRSADKVQTNEFTDNIKNSFFSKKLLYIGVLEERRNIVFLLETFKKVSAQIPNVCLILIGKGKPEYVSMCMKKIEELGIKDRVIYKESLEQKYMPAVYQACDAFLLPTRYEIFGMVLLEAMYYGLPVFTTYNGGSSTLMNESNGVVINSLDVSEWSGKISQVLTDENRCVEIGKSAHQTIADNYTWDALADKFLEVYNLRLKK